MLTDHTSQVNFNSGLKLSDFLKLVKLKLISGKLRFFSFKYSVSKLNYNLSNVPFFVLVDECISPDLKRCENGGTCVPVKNDSSCICAAGYSGKFCETNIDDCASSPCLNGNCTDKVNDYSCDCEDGSLTVDTVLIVSLSCLIINEFAY